MSESVRLLHFTLLLIYQKRFYLIAKFPFKNPQQIFVYMLMGVLKICIVVVNTPLYDSIIKKLSWIRLDLCGHLFSDRL